MHCRDSVTYRWDGDTQSNTSSLASPPEIQQVLQYLEDEVHHKFSNTTRSRIIYKVFLLDKTMCQICQICFLTILILTPRQNVTKFFNSQGRYNLHF